MNSSYRKYIVWFISIVIIGYLAWFFSWIVSYILISTVFSLILKPLKKGIERVRIGRLAIPPWLNAIICIAVLYTLILAFISAFVPLIWQQAYALSNIDTAKVIENFEKPLQYIEEFMIKYQISENPSEMARQYLNKRIEEVFDIGNIRSIFSSFVGFTGNLFVTLFAVTFITFFFTKDNKLPKQIILSIVPAKHARKTHRVLVQAERLLTRYFIGLIFQVTGVTLVAYLGLTIIGVKNALLIGFFAGIVNIVPYLGPIMGALFGAIVVISTNLEADLVNQLIPLIFKICLVFIIVQLTDNMIFQPVIFSNSVKAHPLEIFLIVLVGARLAGVIGMVAAIPTYTFIRIIAKEFLNEFELVKKLTQNL